MALTKQQIKIISENPLENRLDHLRERLRVDVDNPLHEDIIGLLGALHGSPAGFSLPSPDGNGKVEAKLSSIQQGVRSGAVGLDEFRPLVRHVVDKSADTDIWEAVFNIINSLSALTPPPSSVALKSKETPTKPSSSRLADSETRVIVEAELFEEIKNCTFRNVEGFWEKFFNSESWCIKQQAMLKKVLTAHNGKKWKAFPKVPDEEPVWRWLQSLAKRFLKQAPYKFHTTKTANQFQERKGQVDLFLQRPAAEGSDKFSYKDVLVVGELKKSYDTGRFKANFLQLTRHVRSVFADQPTRRFVHAFSLCGCKMELWIFDRSGAYSSGTFDIHSEPKMLARALVGYATMDDDTMGLDTFIEQQDGHCYVTLDDANGKETRHRLDKLMIRQKAIVCRGTTCYETQDSHVAKFSWTSDKRKLEVEPLKQAEAMGAKGVARVVAHRRITTVAEMREGLQFPAPHHFQAEDKQFDDLPTTTSMSSKRKSSADCTSGNASGSKRRRSSNTKPSLYTPGEDLWENRIYSCLVVSPAGRVISDFRSIKELLESERDAIKAHRSLYVTGKILHRDISPNNIIITNPETANGFKGMLIDLDLAKVLDSEPSGARHRTGTMQFIAIEVLRKKDHTYRHDLESFFYVLLWMCAHQAWSNGFAGKEIPAKYSRLRKWEIGRFEDIADAKRGQMAVDGLQDIMEEFPEALDVVKPVCLKIRNTLFPYNKDMTMSVGTPIGDPDQLYNPIIAALEEAISKL
ncbi:serine/threonine-protein kinase Sgk2 [Ceratocystis lukuohia]